MRLTRCFSPEPLRADSVVALPASVAAHVTRVLRLRAGALVTLFDGSGGEYEARLLDTGPRGVRAQVGELRSIERETPVQLRLLQGLARGERMDWVVQKATELGVATIVPIQSEHSVVQLDADAAARRLAHWRAVTISACEQCGRNRLPELISVMDMEAACRQAADPGPNARPGAGLLLSPAAGQSLPAALAAIPRESSISLLVGPEGGLSDSERNIAQRHGFRAVRLGPRVLRAETAPLAALAAIQALIGDFI